VRLIRKFSLVPATLVLLVGYFANANTPEPEAVQAVVVEEPPPAATDAPAEKETPAPAPAEPAKPEESGPAKTDNTPAPTETEPAKETEAEENPDALPATEVRPAKRLGEEKPVVHGWVEWAEICDPPIKLKAKLDTGAKTSSVHAEDARLFERDGAKWVRFNLVDTENKKHPREAPLERIARIKRPNGESEPRYVVLLDLKIGERELRREFTLNERPNMIYAVLLGRSTLKGLGPVDSNRAFIVTPRSGE